MAGPPSSPLSALVGSVTLCTLMYSWPASAICMKSAAGLPDSGPTKLAAVKAPLQGRGGATERARLAQLAGEGAMRWVTVGPKTATAAPSAGCGRACSRCGGPHV